MTPRELGEGFTLEVDSEGRPAGIEILDVSWRFADSKALEKVVLAGFDPSA